MLHKAQNCGVIQVLCACMQNNKRNVEHNMHAKKQKKCHAQYACKKKLKKAVRSDAIPDITMIWECQSSSTFYFDL